MKKKVIIDCDPGIDDSLALMLALESPEIEIIGITVVSGNVKAAQGAENALKVLRLMNREDINVYIGDENGQIKKQGIMDKYLRTYCVLCKGICRHRHK